MKLLTHTAFGLFLGTLFFYFLGFDFGFVLLTGFAAFIPDIDWTMQNRWKMGAVHRKVLHNVWVMLGLALVSLIVTRQWVLSFGIIIGFLSHLIADSLTITGVYWAWPFGKEEKKYFRCGPVSTGKEIEKYIQLFLFGASGFIFISKGINIDVLSINGLVTLGVLIFVGFTLMKTMGKNIKKTIRSLKI